MCDLATCESLYDNKRFIIEYILSFLKKIELASLQEIRRNLTAGGNTIYPSDNDCVTIASLVFSTAGIVFSNASLALLFLTALLFKQWRTSYKNQLLLQFMLARFLFAVTRYSVDLGQFFSRRHEEQATKLYLHLVFFAFMYTETALVIWMLVFTKQMYDSVVKVFYFQTSHRLLKTSLVSWLAPAVVYGLVLVAIRTQWKYFPVIFLSYFFLFKWPVVFATAVMLGLILRSALRRRKSGGSVKAVVVMILMICMFCVQQVVHDVFRMLYFYFTNVKHKNGGYFEAFSVIFNIVTLFHCSISIIFWLFGNRKTRDCWRFKKRVVSTLLTNVPDVQNVK